jgi:hypothetical protein
MKEKETTVLWWLTTLGGAAGGLIAIGAVVAWTWNVFSSVATVDYHENDLKELKVEVEEKMLKHKSSVETIESSVLVPRIMRQLERRCEQGGQLDPAVMEMVNRWRARYEEIEGRPFGLGRCTEDGRLTFD